MKTKKNKINLSLLLGVMTAISAVLVVSAWAQVSQEDLEAISVPDELHTSIGNLKFESGAPTPETAQTVYDYLDQMRGVQAFLDNQGAASMYAMRRAYQKLGSKNANQYIYYETPLDAKSVWLVANSQTVYFTSFLNLKKDGPTVVEVAPGTLGFWDSMWQKYIADYGPVGQDKGKGGKYLILPPGYEGEIPDGYFIVKSPTYGVWNFGRGFLQDGDPKPALENIKAHARVYPLSKKDNPPETEFINASGMDNNTISPANFQFFEDMNQLIQEEPVDSLGAERRGVLKAIGIVKGQSFEPDDRMKKILTDSANIGHAAFRSLWWRPREDTNALYKGTKSQWTNGYPDRNTTFIKDGAMLLDARVQMYTIGTGVTPAMATVQPGEGSDYTFVFLDAGGDSLDGAKNYKLTFPPMIPVANFWSIIVYDAQTRSMLPTSQPGATLSSVFGGLDQNTDGTTDIYFGPKAPAGKENNWLETTPDKRWFICLRMYGATEPWLNKTWRPSEIELVK